MEDPHRECIYALETMSATHSSENSKDKPVDSTTLISRDAMLADIFNASPQLVSEDDCAENVVIPFLQRLGYHSGQIRRKVTIIAASGTKFKKQADIIIYSNNSPAMIIETKKIQHRLQEEDANQVLAYTQIVNPPAPYAILTNGRNWEVYQLFNDTIGGIDDVPEPLSLEMAITSLPSLQNKPERTEAAERILVTIENRDKLEAAFRHCRGPARKRGANSRVRIR